MNKKKKKTIIILGSVIGLIALIYIGMWLLFYYMIASPHLPNDFFYDPERPVGSSYKAYYCEENAYGNYDLYSICMPKFGTFRCRVGFTSSRNYIEEENIMVNMSGSKFAYSMGTTIGLTGKSNRYYVSANYYSSPEVRVPNSLYYVVDHDGNLLNKDELSTEQLSLFDEAQPEIVEYIKKLDEIYSL